MDGVRSNLGWRSSWWMVLWAGAILHCSFHVAQVEGAIPIEVVPSVLMETKEVLLIPPPLPADIIFCTWFRKIGESEAQIITMVLLLPPGNTELGPAYTGRETVYPNCTLRIENLSLSDTATYLLTEGGSLSSNSGNVSLEVKEVVPEPSVTISPSPFLMEFQSVQLHCNTPIIYNVSWLKDGNSIGPGYNFTDSKRTVTIASLNREDTGDYQCRVSNGITEVTSKAEHLSVIYGPETPTISPNEACLERNTNIKLTCQASSYPEPQYTWFYNDVPKEKGSKLFIENLDENQTGIYVCEAMNELLQNRSRSKLQHIHLKESCVRNVVITGPSEGIEGEDVFLNCTAEGDDVQYSWMKENQTVDESGDISLANNGQSLIFKPCHRRDAAKYKCHAQNDYSSDESEFFGLSIIYGPDPPFINETVNIGQGEETISLACVAVAFPATDNQWFFNGQQVPDDPRLLILDIVPANSGNYTCRAKNPRSGLTRETTLEIDMIKRQTSLRRR